MKKIGWVVFFLGLFVSLVGCGSLDPVRIAERSIRRSLTDMIGPAVRYDVRITRKGSRVTSGYISHIVITGEEVVTKGGLPVQRIEADLNGVRFDTRRRSLTGIENTSFIAYVTQSAATDYLIKRKPQLPDLSVSFEPAGITVRAAPKVLGISFPLTLRGKGEVEDGNRIRFETDALAISRLNIPPMAFRLVMDHINPVFDLDDLGLPATLHSVESLDGVIALHGMVSLVQLD